MIENYRVYLAHCIINGDLHLTTREWKGNGCQTYRALKGGV